jgi:hypothetical protein
MSPGQIAGGCHCGSVRYVITAPPVRHVLCHCQDCRRCAGAHAVGWAVVEIAALQVAGEVASYKSSGDVRRDFCPKCGTGLFYRSQAQFPGKVDIQSGTFDDPEICPPTEAIQLADAPSWIATVGMLPQHLRFSGDG